MSQVLETGTYEVIRERLHLHARELQSKLDQLNAARKATFGTIEFVLQGSDRITTPHNCIPRDMVALGKATFLFGYNVHFGLKTETQLEDVFSIYEYREKAFHHLPLEILRQGDFEAEFKNLYKYYKQTTLSLFRLEGPHLFMAFQVGKNSNDLKTFKWVLEDEKLVYLGNRFDHEFKFPPTHGFVWKRATRDDFRSGKHPHVSIEEMVFVETIGGDLTIKVEDNTESGLGIYSEPVEKKDQTLDDAEISYSRLGHLILLKIRPYQEKDDRYYVFNHKTAEVVRLDGIGFSCHLLPEDQGLIFPGGIYLATGSHKVFENDFSEMIFSCRIEAPNGEDSLFVFYHRASGTYAHFSYNRISQEVVPPHFCHGYSLFSSGQMVLFRSESEPQKHHTVQLWQTPYLGRNVVSEALNDSFLAKLGNSSVVSALAECHEILKLLHRGESFGDLYVDLVRRCGAVGDSFFWLNNPEAFGIRSSLEEIKQAAGSALDEFHKVRAIKKATQAEVEKVSNEAKVRIKGIDYHQLTSIELFVDHLTALRGLRGRLISLKDLRYVDLPPIALLEDEITSHSTKLSELIVLFLVQPTSLSPYEARISAQRDRVPALTKATEATLLEKEIDETGEQLEMLIEVVSSLKIEDATQTTEIIAHISSLYGSLNQVRSTLKNRKRELKGSESAAQFIAQIKLLEQSTTNFLDLADSAKKCDEFLSRLTLQLEELEGKYLNFDEYIDQLTTKRVEIYAAFEARKVQLNESRGKKAATLASSADRLLKTIRSRADSLQSPDEIHGYFAADMMVSKVRETIAQLMEMGESVQGDEIQSRLKTVREDAVRQLKDRQELFSEGENIIRLGGHSFTVNIQPLDLTVVPREEGLMLHIGGTNFFESLGGEEFEDLRELWDLEFISESKTVYRAEFLAYTFFKVLEHDSRMEEARTWDPASRLERIREFMAPRYQEGYVKGVHDLDASLFLGALLVLQHRLETLRFSPQIRAFAMLAWGSSDPVCRESLQVQISSFGHAANLFKISQRPAGLLEELTRLGEVTQKSFSGFEKHSLSEVAEYLVVALAQRPDFRISSEAFDLASGFIDYLRQQRALEDFESARKKLHDNPRADFALVSQWVQSYHRAIVSSVPNGFLSEAAVLIFQRTMEPRMVHQASSEEKLEKLVGSHSRFTDKESRLNFHEFTERLQEHQEQVVPRFVRLGVLKRDRLEKRRRELRLETFRPRILSSFVRSRLIDEVYLPMIGANLAKQIGVAGENKRTDRMGLLLLISPPGYGKTTLVEYLSHRLGLVFVKVNGPALGHEVTSLDPGDAPNAAAREEIVKLNLALEMGDNVLICLDDIQHCNPEFLQKFISLCDAQRKIEGVWNNEPRSYDLRGRKVVVVMAGNPYTESGEKFKIPDMLSNRADTYNLGDIIGSNSSSFEQSYLENSVSSNPILQRLTAQGQADIRQIIRLAETGSAEGAEFQGNYSPEEFNEMVATMTHLVRIRNTLLRVNQEYIRSASQNETFRTEPAFKLQGSYRNMNRLAEKVLPIMNEAEVEALLQDHYKSDSQTLTTGAEANLLKLKEMLGILTEPEAIRWAEIKQKFLRNQLLSQADGTDPVGKVVGQLVLFHESLEQLRGTLAHGFAQAAENHARLPLSVGGGMISTPAVSSPAVESPREIVSSGSTGNEASSPYTVEVRYGVPETFTNIIQSQFEMMQAWTRHAFNADKLKSEELQYLNVQINSLSENYKLLIQNLRKNKEL